MGRVVVWIQKGKAMVERKKERDRDRPFWWRNCTTIGPRACWPKLLSARSSFRRLLLGMNEYVQYARDAIYRTPSLYLLFPAL